MAGSSLLACEPNKIQSLVIMPMMAKIDGLRTDVEREKQKRANDVRTERRQKAEAKKKRQRTWKSS